jgi:hypothetical protein
MAKNKRIHLKNVSLVLTTLILMLVLMTSAFAIDSISVTSPNGDDVLNGDVNIAWTQDVDGNVNIRFTSNNWGTSTSIANGVGGTLAGPNTFSWDTSALPDGTTYQIRILSAADPSVYDTTANFELNNEAIYAAAEEDLDTAEAAAAALTEAHYTVGSWESLQNALGLPAGTLEQIEDKTAAIDAAIAALVFAGQADLDAAEATAGDLIEAHYTVDSWAALTAALGMDANTNAEVVAKAAAIDAAIAALVDISALTAAITAEVGADRGDLVYDLTEADYTADSWTAYSAAIAAAILVEADADATQEAVTDATALIASTKAALVFAGQADLDAAEATAGDLIEADYTVDSWATLTAALGMDANTNAEVVAKAAAIDAAIAALVDISALTAAITAEVGADHETPVFVLTEADYTVDSWTAYSAAIAAAILVEADADATQEAVTDATALIASTKAALVDISALTAAITAEVGADHETPVFVLTEADYTADSWTAYSAAIAAAILVEADADATQEAVTDATALIASTKAALVDISALTAAITAEVGADHETPVFVLTEADYTADSWTAYSAAIAAAILVEADADATQEAVTDATALIASTKAALVFAGQADLDAAEATAGDLIEAHYTVDSWAALTAALGMDANTNAEVVAKAAAIDAAIAALVDISALTAAITAEVGADRGDLVYDLTEADYTADSWTAYSAAIAAAILVEADADATQEAVTDATALIASTKAALVDISALTAAITAEVGADHETPVFVLTEADYTVDSWTAYSAAIAAAILVEADADATQEAVTDATALIASTKAALVDISALTAAITAEVGADHETPVFVLTEADYTADSWTAYSAAIAAAILVEADADATQEAVTDATALIASTKAALVDISALTAAITAEVGADHETPVFVLTEADYTADSWTAYSAAIAAAILVEADADATQEAVTDATALIASTKAALVFAGQADLDAAEATAGDLIEAHYTVDSWAALTAALAMDANTNAEVVAKTAAIDAAIAALVFAGQAALDAAEATAGDLIEAHYTVDSWAALTAALAMDANTNAEVVAKTAAIDAAILGLEISAVIIQAVEAAEAAAGDLVGDGSDTQAAIDAAQDEYDAALILVNGLPDGEVKDDLLDRLAIVLAFIQDAQAEFDAYADGDRLYGFEFAGQTGNGFTALVEEAWFSLSRLSKMKIWPEVDSEDVLYVETFLNSAAGDDAERLTASNVNVMYVYNAQDGWTTVESDDFADTNLPDITRSLNYFVFDLHETAAGKSIRHVAKDLLIG